MALARAARRLGVRMRTQTPATAITIDRGRVGRVTGVETATGPIACETVVVAVGPWSELLGAALGLRFDTIPIRHQLWVDRKSTRLNSSHLVISYAVFCLKKKNQNYKSI